MTDAPVSKPKSSLLVQDARTKRRNASEARFKIYGLAAIGIGCAFLLTLLTAILFNGVPAFKQTFVTLSVTLDPAAIEDAENSTLKTAKYKAMVSEALLAELTEVGIQTDMDPTKLGDMLSSATGDQIRTYALAHPEQMGQTVEFTVLGSSRVDGYMKGRVTREALANDKNLDAEHLDIVDQLAAAGKLSLKFNPAFIFGSDASEKRPEQAGLGVSVVGSFIMMLVVLFLSLPIGVAASIYLEEFAPKSRLTDLIEVNISNLAAVPSIVFGILGVAVFIQFGGGSLGIDALRKSAPLVGGLVLTLMTLPTIIISTRAALKAVPPSIREAALGVGASRMQAVFHHVLPLAAPGILTGTIIGLAQALGETAPLLLIGMVGFVATNYPSGFFDAFTAPNSAMPAQIYEWAKRADPAFYERAWGGIIILLVFLLALNIIAVILRSRFERRW